MHGPHARGGRSRRQHRHQADAGGRRLHRHGPRGRELAQTKYFHVDSLKVLFEETSFGRRLRLFKKDKNQIWMCLPFMTSIGRNISKSNLDVFALYDKYREKRYFYLYLS